MYIGKLRINDSHVAGIFILQSQDIWRSTNLSEEGSQV